MNLVAHHSDMMSSLWYDVITGLMLLTASCLQGDSGEPGVSGLRGPPGDMGLIGMHGPPGELGRSVPGQYLQPMRKAAP